VRLRKPSSAVRYRRDIDRRIDEATGGSSPAHCGHSSRVECPAAEYTVRPHVGQQVTGIVRAWYPGLFGANDGG
jgi:hypothetical protein